MKLADLAYYTAFVLLLSANAAAQCTPTITFENHSGSDALVKAVGPTVASAEVPDGSVRSVSVSGGTYYTLTRFGSPGAYSYSRGDSFDAKQFFLGNRSHCSRITITLHKVVNGNYS